MATTLNADPFEPFKAKYDVHPESMAFAQAAVDLKVMAYTALTPQQAREQSDRVGRALSGEFQFDGTVTEHVIPCPSSPSDIPITVYRPKSLPEMEKPTIFIFFHGGGLVVGGLAGYDTCMKMLATQSGAIVIFVTYRLLPLFESPLAPFDDALASVQWVMTNRSSLTGCADCIVGVGGDSGGGQLATCVTNDIHGLDFQVLVYPAADVSRKQKSFQEFEFCPGLTKMSIDWFFSHSIDQIPDAINDPRVNPMARHNLERSPPALILLAELDALRDAGIDYAEKLRASGVQVEVQVIPGVTHAFFHLPGVFKHSCASAYSHVARFIRQFQTCQSF